MKRTWPDRAREACVLLLVALALAWIVYEAMYPRPRVVPLEDAGHGTFDVARD